MDDLEPSKGTILEFNFNEFNFNNSNFITDESVNYVSNDPLLFLPEYSNQSEQLDLLKDNYNLCRDETMLGTNDSKENTQQDLDELTYSNDLVTLSCNDYNDISEFSNSSYDKSEKLDEQQIPNYYKVKYSKKKDDVENTIESESETTIESNIETTIQKTIETTIQTTIKSTVESTVENDVENCIKSDDTTTRKSNKTKCNKKNINNSKHLNSEEENNIEIENTTSKKRKRKADNLFKEYSKKPNYGDIITTKDGSKFKYHPAKGRARAKQLESMTQSAIDEELKIRKMRNLLAARQFRARKKAYIESLEDNLNQLTKKVEAQNLVIKLLNENIAELKSKFKT